MIGWVLASMVPISGIADSTSLADAAERVGAEDSVFFSNRFIVPRPLMRAITSEEPTLLLIDEVDKSDPEFEAFLLEVLSDFQVTVPELGPIRAEQPPVVVITSNRKSACVAPTVSSSRKIIGAAITTAIGTNTPAYFSPSPLIPPKS